MSFGPGDKDSPRVTSSGDRVAFVLDGYVTEKPLYTQDSHRRTAMSFGAFSAEWLLDGSLAILAPENKTEDHSAKTTPTLNSLFAAQAADSSSDGSSNVRKLTEEKVETASAVPGGQAIVAAVATSPTPEAPDEPPRSRLVFLWGSEEMARIYLEGHVEGHVTGLCRSRQTVAR